MFLALYLGGHSYILYIMKYPSDFDSKLSQKVLCFAEHFELVFHPNCFIIVFSMTASDAGGTGMDDMKLLEQRAQVMAAEAEADKPKPKKDILFVR